MQVKQAVQADHAMQAVQTAQAVCVRRQRSVGFMNSPSLQEHVNVNFGRIAKLSDACA